MALNLEDKKALVAEVAEVAAKAQSVVAAEYRGLTVGQMTELRSKARAQGVYMRVVKNTLARKAFAGTSFESCRTEAQGTAGAGVLEGRSGRSRARGEGLREGERQAGGDCWCRSAGRCCPAADLEKVASLPTREQALSMLLGVHARHRSRSSSPRLPSLRPSSSARWPRCATRSRPPPNARFVLKSICGDPTWLSAKTKSSMPFPR